MSDAELDVKTRILLTAKKLFAEQGYDGTSVRQICDGAGANISLVSYHFGGKEKVFAALFERYFLVNVPKILNDKIDLMSPVEGIASIVGELVRFNLSEREMSDIIQFEMVLQTNRRSIMYPYLEPLWMKLTTLLQAGKDQGIFRIKSVSYGMLLVLSSALAHQRAYNTKYGLQFEQADLDEIVEQTVEFALRGLGVCEYEYKDN